VIFGVLLYGALVRGPMGEFIRNLGIFFVLPLVAIQLFGSLPRQLILACLRICISLPLIVAAWISYKEDHEAVLPTFFLLYGLTLGIAPYFGFQVRRWLYGGMLAIGAVGIVGVQFILPDSTVLLIFPGILWICQVVLFANWTMKLASPLDGAALDVREQCQRMTEWLNQPGQMLAINSSRERLKFTRELERFFEVTRSPDSMRVLREICSDYKGIPLAWQVAYTSAITARDYGGAAELMRQAHEAGHEGALGNLPLAYALSKIGDPGWQKSLARALARGEVSATSDDFLRDPFVKWRTNPQFGRFESALMPGSEFLPPRIVV